MGYIKQTLSDGEELVASFNLNIWMYFGIYFQLALSIGIIIFSFVAEDIFYDILDSSGVANQVGNIPDGIISKVILFIGVLLFAKGLYQYLLFKSLDMGITDKRVVYKKGIIGRQTDEIRLNAIETVEVDQSVAGRMLGYGTVKVTGRGEAILLYKDIDEPIEVKKAISTVINNYSRS